MPQHAALWLAEVVPGEWLPGGTRETATPDAGIAAALRQPLLPAANQAATPVTAIDDNRRSAPDAANARATPAPAVAVATALPIPVDGNGAGPAAETLAPQVGEEAPAPPST